MAIEAHIKRGDDALKEKDYLGAILNYGKAINENPDAFAPHLKRASAYQRLSDYDSARKDISKAYGIAEGRGKRSDLGLCYFRLGLLYYVEKKLKLAKLNLSKAKEFDCQEKSVDMWLTKVDYDLNKNPPPDSDEEDEDLAGLDIPEDGAPQVTPEETPAASRKTKEVSAPADSTSDKSLPSTSLEAINQHAPLKMKVRTDWYQSKTTVTIDIFAKGIDSSKLKVDFTDSSVHVSFPSSPSSEYSYSLEPLYAKISATESSYKLMSTKLEVTLVKTDSAQWPLLESDEDAVAEPASGPAYPTSAKKQTNWNALKLDDDDDEKNDDPNAFFAKLYKDCDEDTRRAMMKSYVQSNGTVLTTSWDEAKDKEFEVSPPEGMEAHKWQQ